MFSTSSIGQYLGELAARQPAPGGGAVAALHAAQAAALVAMVARYTTRAKDAAHRPTVDRIIAAADEARGRGLALADEDAVAFTAVGQAYQLPKATEAEAAVRSAAIAESLTLAARVPAEVIAVAAEVLTLAEELRPIANPNVITDVGAAADACRAAAGSSRLNIEINLRSLSDTAADEFAETLKQAEQLADRADELHAAVAATIRG